MIAALFVGIYSIDCWAAFNSVKPMYPKWMVTGCVRFGNQLMIIYAHGCSMLVHINVLAVIRGKLASATPIAFLITLVQSC